ncbi:MAG: hypothetical protein M0R32_06010 [Candidatus Cloacimonetes bacterium]|jgi:hypothetical protein|nr:hypothetical protein [Candidatus Cloacimonadota bacterium]
MKKRLTNQQQILADEVGASGGTFLMPGGKGSINHSQSIGRSKRNGSKHLNRDAKKRYPIRHSPYDDRGIWEVDSINLSKCGLSREQIARAILIYSRAPFQDQDVWLLKSRYDAHGLTSMENFNEYFASAVKEIEKFEIAQLELSKKCLQDIKTKPLTIKIDWNKDWCAAKCTELEVSGMGETPLEAFKAVSRSINSTIKAIEKSLEVKE